MRRIPLPVAVIGSLVLGACAIQEDASPQVISPEDRGNFGVVEPTGEPAEGANRIFLLSPTDPGEQQQLRAVQRDVPGSASALLSSLIAGPNTDEQAERLSTAIPPDLELLDVRPVGRVLTVDVNDALGDLTAEALRLAVAQIVTTGSELDNVDSVRLRVDGEDQAWPLGDGGLESRSLTVYDYPGLVESSQPALPSVPTPQA
jgi:hypothetical protein